MNELLMIDNLSISIGKQLVLKNINIKANQGEILCIVGESGSGKSTILNSINGFLSPRAKLNSGQILINGKEILKLSEKEKRNMRGELVGSIFQEPGSTLNPVRKIGKQFKETLIFHKKAEKNNWQLPAIDAILKAGLKEPNEILDMYPFQLSGGMKQRVSIALAMSLNPKILLADEPTSALDSLIQKKVIKSFVKTRDEYNTTIVIVTHNLAVANYIADKIVVLKKGEIVEQGSSKDVIYNSKEKYTRELIENMPKFKVM